MLDDVDTLTEDDVPPDEGILTILQTEDENDWEEVSLDLMTGHRSVALSKLHSDRPPYVVSKLPSLNTYTGLLKKMQTDCLIDVPPAILAMGRSEARTCVRRLLNLLSTECTFYSIYERNEKRQQIIFDLTNSELSKAYSPQILKDIRKRLRYISNGTKVILNDHHAMQVLEERLEDLRKDKITKMESNLEQLEADRIRLLLLQGLLNREMFDAELLKQGELLHQRRRNDPVILMHKNRRGAKNLPVFCPNPLKDAYRVCHREKKEFNSRLGEYEGITKLADPRKNSGTFVGKGRVPIKLEHLSSDSSYSSISYGFLRGFALRPVIPCVSEEDSIKSSVRQNRAKHFLPKVSGGSGSIDSFLRNLSTDGSREEEKISQIYKTARRLLRCYSKPDISDEKSAGNVTDDSENTTKLVETESSGTSF
ncbi:hypothetical protein PHET_01310 [Paragonimus heterotremus]|uniref:Uncharacterized protein n=1 Tax=Paragonimus heterotremus TaxID=100268 RepID=A0A8J4WKI4_9TREM|nr:hypothetical protein PHET_01310 [Paragonimus heterotremus]